MLCFSKSSRITIIHSIILCPTSCWPTFCSTIFPVTCFSKCIWVANFVIWKFSLLPYHKHQRTNVVTINIIRKVLFSYMLLLLLQWLQPLYQVHLLGNQFLKDQVFFGHDNSNLLPDNQLVYLYFQFQ